MQVNRVRHNPNLLISYFLLLACCAFGCGLVRNLPEQNSREIKLFSPNEVCVFPANSTIQKFHFLGGGTWQPVSNVDARLGFSCGLSNTTVQLFGDGGDFINVEYSATGSERGATAVSIVYSASASRAIDNEETLRTVYTNFVNEVSLMTLKQALPELARKKILNLNSYSPAGSENADSFFVGDGFITLGRIRDVDNTSALVKTQIYSDKALKLE